MPVEGVVTTTSSLPVVRNAAQSEEMATANQLDRMNIWLKNVESKLSFTHSLITYENADLLFVFLRGR